MVSQAKFKSLVHYVCSRRANAPDTLGAVKLNKILWLADLSAFYERGSPITDSRYIKREYGPVPARIMPALQALQSEGVLTVREANHFGKQKKEYIVHFMSSGDFMSSEEKEIVDRVIDHVCDDHTASSVSEASHNHIWMAAEVGEELPLYTVFAKPGRITETERAWAQMVIESESATE
jgi:predicted small metal-binding protein